MAEAAIRPMHHVRINFDRDVDGCGEWLLGLFRDEQAAIKSDLERLRAEGQTRTDPGIRQLTTRLTWSITLIADLEGAIASPHLNPRTGRWERLMRLFRGGQAVWVQAVIRGEQAALLDDLHDLRAERKPEDDPEVMTVSQQVRWSVNVLRDLDVSLILLAGPDEDPRPH